MSDKDAWPQSRKAQIGMAAAKAGLPAGESKVPDSAINAIAAEMDKQEEHEAMAGDYEVPEEYRTSLSNMGSVPKMTTKMIMPNAKDETQKMIDSYVQANGSYIVPQGQSVEAFKKELKGESEENDDELLLG